MKPQRRAQAKPVQVFLPLALQLKGGRKTIISPVPLSQVAPRKPSFDNAMIKAVARAFSWRGRIEQGEFQSITELAKAERVNPSYACRLLRLTLLAPDIVQAIVDGTHNAELTLRRLLQPFPMRWQAQRELFCFTGAVPPLAQPHNNSVRFC